MPGEAQSVLRVFVANGQKGNKEGRVPPPSSKSERRRKKKKKKVPVLLLMMIQYGGAKAANSTDQTLCPAISINTYNTNPISIQ